MNRNFIAILTLVVAGMVGLVVATSSSDDAGASVSRIENPRIVQENDHVRGAENAKVTLIEYGDFGCPGCGGLHPLLLAIEAEFSEDLEVIFRNFPLISLHPNAMVAHRAAEAASLQGKFWEMHDVLYENQASWTARSANQTQAIAIIEGYAAQIGLDVDQFKTDVASQGVFDYINAQQESGSDLGLTGTPSLLLNGEEIATPRDFPELRAVIQAVIAGDDDTATEEDSSESENTETEDAEASDTDDSESEE